MGPQERGLQLRCRDGHFEMAAFEVKAASGGFWMWVACELDGHSGGHWLTPDASRPGALLVASQPYCWPSAVEAYEARDRWEAQQNDA